MAVSYTLVALGYSVTNACFVNSGADIEFDLAGVTFRVARADCPYANPVLTTTPEPARVYLYVGASGAPSTGATGSAFYEGSISGTAYPGYTQYGATVTAYDATTSEVTADLTHAGTTYRGVVFLWQDGQEVFTDRPTTISPVLNSTGDAYMSNAFLQDNGMPQNVKWPADLPAPRYARRRLHVVGDAPLVAVSTDRPVADRRVSWRTHRARAGLRPVPVVANDDGPVEPAAGAWPFRPDSPFALQTAKVVLPDGTRRDATPADWRTPGTTIDADVNCDFLARLD